LGRKPQELSLALVNAYLVCNTKHSMAEDSRIMRVGGHEASVASGPFWRIAILTAIGVIGTASHAEAALYYWSDSDPGFSGPAPMVTQRRQKPGRRQGKRIDAPARESAKPQGPLIIAISIDRQNLRIYDANGFFAETPISTGMRGHSTPMGVFSVIQKQKLHHSNIYSGAPMPYMQRITWSGIALHAGVLPGYPASHGCIRMPTTFAVKMWGWTRMGARVVITPGEMTPADFSHPLLVAQKAMPQPTTANEPKADAPAAAKADKASEADAKPAISQASLELRSTVGHGDGVKPVMGEPSASTPLSAQTRTADASAALPTTKASVTMSDAAPSSTPAQEQAASGTDNAPPLKDADKKTDEAEPPAQVSGNAVKLDAYAGESIKTDETKAEAKADEINKAPSKADAPPSSKKPDENVRALTDAGTSVPDAKKDPTNLPLPDKVTSIPDPAPVTTPKRTGQIAVFVSRKDSKLYVRQNFAPLFDVPVTIAPSDRPLGTHVFTAQVDKNDANVLHWSVVSLPVPASYAERRDEDERAWRRRKMTGAVEMKVLPVPDSPAEALDRLTIPADAMARISEALSTGSSIIVSDQGIGASETGEGTDFIVSLR
jgi:hypothetical protein